MASFKEMVVWQKSVDLTEMIYQLCLQLPSEERYGMTSQMQRAATAIPSNIAEGHRRNNRKEYYQFCGIALGSAAELETQLIITSRVYSKINTKEAIDLCVEVQKMLNSLIRRLKS